MVSANKTTNTYADAIPEDLYDRTPKAVFAAIAVSALSAGGDRFADSSFDIAEALRTEWAALHASGVVPQKPPRTLR